jgi:hypothetical protein
MANSQGRSHEIPVLPFDPVGLRQHLHAKNGSRGALQATVLGPDGRVHQFAHDLLGGECQLPQFLRGSGQIDEVGDYLCRNVATRNQCYGADTNSSLRRAFLKDFPRSNGTVCYFFGIKRPIFGHAAFFPAVHRLRRNPEGPRHTRLRIEVRNKPVKNALHTSS